MVFFVTECQVQAGMIFPEQQKGLNLPCEHVASSIRSDDTNKMKQIKTKSMVKGSVIARAAQVMFNANRKLFRFFFDPPLLSSQTNVRRLSQLLVISYAFLHFRVAFSQSKNFFGRHLPPYVIA